MVETLVEYKFAIIINKFLKVPTFLNHFEVQIHAELLFFMCQRFENVIQNFEEETVVEEQISLIHPYII